MDNHFDISIELCFETTIIGDESFGCRGLLDAGANNSI